MNKAASSVSAVVLIAILTARSGAIAQSAPAPDNENGRYALSPIPDGVIRLDTRTGAVSTCNNNGVGWACYAVPDERKALDEEIGRLQAESAKAKADVDRLKAELASRAPAEEALPKPDSPKKAEPKTAENERENERKIEIPLPSDRDMDRVMTFLEQAWRRLVELANRMQKDVSGKI
jgi:hypothetical protein